MQHELFWPADNAHARRKVLMKTKFYNQLKPEIILILFKKSVRKNVSLECADRLILQKAPTHLSDKPSQRRMIAQYTAIFVQRCLLRMKQKKV
jgi:hypothetical protein